MRQEAEGQVYTQPHSQLQSERRSDRYHQLSGNHVEPDSAFPERGLETDVAYTQVKTLTFR